MKRWLGLALVLAACGSSREAAPAPAPAEPAPAAVPAPVVPAPREALVERRPAEPARPAPTEALRWRTLLAEGRVLERAGNHLEAVARYRAALTIAPGNAAILGELGWALFGAGRLDEALETTDEALTRAIRAAEVGMLEYNAGRILEAQNQRAEAIECYRRSLEARPNATVEARLRSLGARPLGQTPLSEYVEPFLSTEALPSLVEVCDHVAPGWRRTPGEDPELYGEHDDLRPQCPNELADTVRASTGILEAGILNASNVDGENDSRAFLVARTAAGYFVLAQLGSEYYSASLTGGTYTVTPPELVDLVPGGALELRSRSSTNDFWANWCMEGSTDDDRTLVCGAVEAGIACYLDVHSRRSTVGAGGWGMGEEGDCDDASEEDYGSSETPIVLTFEADGRVRIDGDDPPVALREAVEIVRVPCLFESPEAGFGCAGSAAAD